MVLKEGNAFVRRTGYTRHSKDGPDGATDEIGIKKVGQGITNDDCISLCSIGRTQDRLPKLPGFSTRSSTT